MKAKRKFIEGKVWKFPENVSAKKEEEAIRTFSSSFSGFEFWNNPKENIYQDYLNNATPVHLYVQ